MPEKKRKRYRRKEQPHDAVFKVFFGDAKIAKSYLPTLPIFLQLLDYFLQIWEDDIKNERPLSFIIPIVVYHGKRRWEKKPFSEYFPGLPEVFQRFIPNFDFVLTDLSLIPPQVIKVHGRRPLFLCWGMRDAEEEGISNVP